MVKMSAKNLIFIFILGTVIIVSSIFFSLRNTDADLSVEEPCIVEQLVIDEKRVEEKKEASMIEKILANKRADVLSGEEDEQLEPQILGETDTVINEPKEIGTSITIETDGLEGQKNINTIEEEDNTRGVSTSFTIVE
jgi:hypothetical protein